MQGFYTVTESSSLEEGAKSCITLSGLGKLAPNMILMGFKVRTVNIFFKVENSIKGILSRDFLPLVFSPIDYL
jgi:hypothetical protein